MMSKQGKVEALRTALRSTWINTQQTVQLMAAFAFCAAAETAGTGHMDTATHRRRGDGTYVRSCLANDKLFGAVC